MFITIEEFAEELRIDTATILAWVDTGVLSPGEYLRVNDFLRFDRALCIDALVHATEIKESGCAGKNAQLHVVQKLVEGMHGLVELLDLMFLNLNSLGEVLWDDLAGENRFEEIVGELKALSSLCEEADGEVFYRNLGCLLRDLESQSQSQFEPPAFKPKTLEIESDADEYRGSGLDSFLENLYEISDYYLNHTNFCEYFEKVFVSDIYDRVLKREEISDDSIELYEPVPIHYLLGVRWSASEWVDPDEREL